jgi:hypothetical protein
MGKGSDMIRRVRFTRRQVFVGVFLALLVILGAVDNGRIVSAEATKAKDHGSALGFERACARMGGSFVVERSGELVCRFANGKIVCNATGNDCWFHPAAQVAADGAIDLGSGGTGDAERPSGSAGSAGGDVDPGPDTEVYAP